MNLIERSRFLSGKLNIKKRKNAFGKTQEASLLELIQLEFFMQNYQNVADLCFGAVLCGVPTFVAEIAIYRHWIAALEADFDSTALLSLGDHLWKMRKRSLVFASLTLLAYVKGDVQGKAGVVYCYLRSVAKKNHAVQEAMAQYLLHYGKSAQRSTILRKYPKFFADPNPDFISLWDFFQLSLTFQNHSTTLYALSLLLKNYPDCLATQIYQAEKHIESNRLGVAHTLLTHVLNRHPKHFGAALLLAKSYSMGNDFLAANEVLQKFSDIEKKFPEYSYDYFLTQGQNQLALYHRYENQSWRFGAWYHLQLALEYSKALQLRNAAVPIACNQLDQETAKPVENRGYVLLVQPDQVSQFLVPECSHLNCPSEIKKGDRIFIAVGEIHSLVQIFGQIVALSDCVEISHQEKIAQFGEPHLFDELKIVQWEMDEWMERFSESGAFYALSREGEERIEQVTPHSWDGVKDVS